MHWFRYSNKNTCPPLAHFQKSRNLSFNHTAMQAFPRVASVPSVASVLSLLINASIPSNMSNPSDMSVPCDPSVPSDAIAPNTASFLCDECLFCNLNEKQNTGGAEKWQFLIFNYK